jgi:hypothetical protein
MTSIEAYKRFLLKINKNDSNTEVSIPVGEFVLIFNEQAKKWLLYKLNSKESSDDIDDLQDLLLHDVVLNKVKTENTHTDFSLPNNFFSYSSSFSIVKGDGCVQRLKNIRVKPKNIEIYLDDEDFKPSIEWKQTILTLSSNYIQVYTNNFSVDSVYLSYYKEPNEIDIEGYIKVDGSNSKNIDSEISDIFVNEIINRCAVEVIRSYQSPEGYSLAEDRIKTEEY